MSTTHSYSIEQDGENFVLIETSDAYGQPVVRVPYSIKQEADSGVSAAAKNSTYLRADRQEIALHLARKASSLIPLIPTAENLLEIRKITEALITASIAEIRKNENVSMEQTAAASVEEKEPSNKELLHEMRRNAALAKGSV
ncbi:hypothetical protein NKW54_12945 [Acetobacter cerevisiae]|uniref:Phage tail protein n=2 Tax=Acetobacter cerevisiae TaxID=178900 RepID=A0ABT1ETY1_9PROT|nr:hypothetical protein [Acetobacter cerevisiae]MCP1246838.1 hypothetical protein [Acetobacter cerevisiae]